MPLAHGRPCDGALLLHLATLLASTQGHSAQLLHRGTWGCLAGALVPAPEVLLPSQVVQALLKSCRPSAVARSCWVRSCQRTSSWTLSACGWSRTTCALPAPCKVPTPAAGQLPPWPSCHRSQGMLSLVPDRPSDCPQSGRQ